MNPVGQALWFIETKLDRELTLDRISANCDMSRFGFAPVLDEHRLAGDALCAGEAADACGTHAGASAPDILQVALDAGYGSHEAFTRAFRDCFGITPEDVRARAPLTGCH